MAADDEIERLATNARQELRDIRGFVARRRFDESRFRRQRLDRIRDETRQHDDVVDSAMLRQCAKQLAIEQRDAAVSAECIRAEQKNSHAYCSNTMRAQLLIRVDVSSGARFIHSSSGA